MDGVGSGELRGGQYLSDVEVTFLGGGIAEGYSLVGHPDRQGLNIDVGVHRHGLDAHASAGPDNAAGYLATVCY